jgi:secreted PhoX family phosphatase
MKTKPILLITGLTVGALAPLGAQTASSGPSTAGVTLGAVTSEAPMIRGDTPATSQGWTVTPLFTISETVGNMQPTGIPDGTGAFPLTGNRVWVLVNSELAETNGYPYSLANGTTLVGARVTRYLITRTASNGMVQVDLLRAGLAYNTIYDRQHQVVVDPAQINETGNGINGLGRLCSAQGVRKGTYGFVDDIFFTGEETGKPPHPHGGTEWALDVKQRALWAVPALGRAKWENVTPLDTGNPGKVALLVGDDTESAPLYLYVGRKNAVGDGSFLDRNGLEVGRLHAWRADNGDLDPQSFSGLNEMRTGTWVALTVHDPASAGLPGYDFQGYADIDTLQGEADSLGCHSFSRPEDVATNPLDGTQAVLASTGRGSLYPADNWGTVYVVDVDFSDLTATLLIIHDADDLLDPDTGVRNPDNLDWAGDGKVYVQEDRGTSPLSLFGSSTGIEASMWALDPLTRAYVRIAEIDRSAIAPAGAPDTCAGDLGCWESSGVLDVTDVFQTLPAERLLLGVVQAKGIVGGAIGGNALLDEGGQIFFMSKIGQD